jgi:hypothetical protein
MRSASRPQRVAGYVDSLGPTRSHPEAMAKCFGYGLLFAIVGLVVAAVAGYFLILWFSSNAHDRSVEASMTGIFVCGPIGAVLGFVAGFIFGGRRSAKPNEHA